MGSTYVRLLYIYSGVAVPKIILKNLLTFDKITAEIKSVQFFETRCIFICNTHLYWYI